MAGVGKSAFVIAAARQLADRYPDAQLYLDLHGYTPGQPPVRLAAALEAMLRVIGVPAEQVPSSEEARTALWRSRTARMSLLLVLDNIRAEEDVRKLLPGSADCMTLITSRRRLIGLQDAHAVSLEPLTPRDASTMLRRMLTLPSATDNDRVQEAVAACGYLPLAITLVAGRIRGRKNASLAQVAADLVSSQDGLANMRAEDRIIMTAFELSYGAVTSGAQVLLRRLAICPVGDFGEYLAAAVMDVAPRGASDLLEELADHSLLLEAHSGRYQFHDLVRTYVRRIAFEQDSAPDRQQNIRKVFLFYQQTLIRVEHSMEASSEQPAENITVQTPPVGTYELAAQWFTDERSNLITTAYAAIDSAAVTEFPELVLILGNQLRVRGYVDEALMLYSSTLEITQARHEDRLEVGTLLGKAEIERVTSRHHDALMDYGHAVEKAREVGDRQAEAAALRGMAVTERLVGNFEESLTLYEVARDISEALGDPQGLADALRGFGRIHQFMGRYAQAMQYHEQALVLSHEAANSRGEADALRGIALVHQAMGNLAEAREYFLRALAIHARLDHRIGQVDSLRGVADTEVQLRLFADATEHYREAAEIAEQVSDQSGIVYVLTGMGRLYTEQGDFEQALTQSRRAAELAHALDEKPAEAWALWQMGKAHLGLGAAPDGVRALIRSRDLFQEVAMPEARQVEEDILRVGG